MEFFDTTKTIIENAYYFSGIIVALLAIIGIYQIILLKKGIIINSKRDAAKLSFEICEKYLVKFTESVTTIGLAYKQYDLVPLFDITIDEFSIEEYNKKFNEEWRQKFEENMKEPKGVEFEQVGNMLDSFAVPMLKGIADEDIAFSVHANSFLAISSLCFPYMIVRLEENNMSFKNAQELHVYWSKKITTIRLNDEKKDIEEKLKRSKTKAVIDPIGAK